VIRLLIVDDSALMRRQLTTLFEAEGDFDIRHARNGREAVELNREFEPHVISLDINMPDMDGLTALSLIMAQRPVGVVMVSSLTEKGALATFEALHLGAIDYVAKPGGTISLSIDVIKDDLISKIRAASRARLKGKTSVKTLSERMRDDRARTISNAKKMRPKSQHGDGLVLIGVSTGGPRTLEEILPQLPADFPWPILVAQHMPAAFTKSFADRLNNVCPLRVSELSQPTVIEPGHIYIGKGGADMLVANRVGRLMAIPKPENTDFLWHPSVELLGRSALEHVNPEAIIGVMLTGMGYDGADAFSEIKSRGGKTIAESEESAVVFGMPAELIERKGASVICTSDKVASQLNRWAGF